MAVFQTIRNKLGPIIVIVIGLSLALFVLETALNSNTKLLGGNKDVVGTIDGEKVHYRDFIVKVDEAVNNYKLQTQQKNLDDNTVFSIRDQTWTQMVNEKLNGEEYNKLGLVVGQDELKDMFFGKDPVSEIKQAFTNPQTGIFDPLAVKNYYDHLDDPPRENEVEGERRLRWVAFEKAQIDQRLSSKYSDLIKNALYVTKWQAEMDYNEKNTRADVNFVMVPYTTISDSTIKVTDEELKQYLDQHKEQFKLPNETRKLDYIIFAVKPSAEDTADVVKGINELYQKLAAAPNDTDLIKLNADNGLDKFYYKKDNISSPFVQDTLMKVPVGSLIGPYFENGAYKIAKLMDRRDVPDSVRSHHILIPVQPGEDSTAARTRIDSIYTAVRNGTSFDSLAMRLSADGSAQKGGDLGFAPQGLYVRAFNQYLFFDGHVGEMKVVRTEFGYHLIRIDEMKNVSPAVQVDFITRPLEASSETDKQKFEQATKFAAENTTQESFTKTAEEQKLNKMSAPSVQKNAYQIPGLTSARDVVKWAFEAKMGEVSSPFALTDNYVVAVLTGIKPEGTATIDDVKPQLEMQVRKQKKGEQIAAQIAAASSLNSTLDAIATKMNQPVKNSSGVMFSNAYSENMGYEPKVVGTVFALKENQLSKPVTGEQGVFVVQVKSFTKPQPIADYSQFRQQLLSSLQPRLQYGLVEALKKSVKIEDNRYLFF